MRTHPRPVYSLLGDRFEDARDAEDAVLVTAPDTVADPRAVPFKLGTLDCCVFSADGPVDVVPYRRQPVAGIALGLVLDGQLTVGQAGREAVLRTGQFTFYEGSHSYRVVASGPHSFLVVRIPLFRLGLVLGDVAGMVATDMSPIGSPAELLAGTLASLAAGQAALSAPARVHCADAVFALIQAVIAERAAPSRQPIALFNVLTQWIEEHLTDYPDARALAAAHHLSTRYVRQIFARNGTTVSRFTRERRLEHARADLVNPQLAMVGVGVLARKWGFESPSVFCRAFRDQYGDAPQPYRRLHMRL